MFYFVYNLIKDCERMCEKNFFARQEFATFVHMPIALGAPALVSIIKT